MNSHELQLHQEYETVVMATLLENLTQMPPGILQIIPLDCLSSANRTIVKTIQKLVDQGITPDLVSVAMALRGEDNFEAMSEHARNTAMSCMPLTNPDKVYQYIEMMKTAKALDKIKKEALKIAEEAGSFIDDVPRFIASIPERFKFELSLKDNASVFSDDYCEVDAMIDAYYNNEPQRVFPTGISFFDTKFGGGLQEGFYVIGARPSMGKTELAIEIAIGLASNGVSVLYEQLELEKNQFYRRILAKLAGIKQKEIVLATAPREQIRKAQDELVTMPFYMNTKRWTVDEFRVYLEVNRGRYSAILIDQYMNIKNKPGLQGQEGHAYNVAGLQAIAKEFGVPVILLAQFNRESTKQEAKTMEGFKSTGSLEEFADVAMVLNRKDIGTRDELMELTILKDRLMDNYGTHTLKYHRGRLVTVEAVN